MYAEKEVFAYSVKNIMHYKQNQDYTLLKTKANCVFVYYRMTFSLTLLSDQ